MKILLTAFEPFGGEFINAAQEAVNRVHGEGIAAELIKLRVPTVFGKAIETVRSAILKERPDAVLAVGQAKGRDALTPERIAINIDDARIPDNEGFTPVDTAIVPGGPPAYFSTLPVKAIISAILAEGIPAIISDSAGTFVCNHLMYGILHTLSEEMPEAIGGFFHVPCLPEQVGKDEDVPSMTLEHIVRGIEITLQVIASTVNK